ncbi:MAG: 4Fe-4S dicluster domain-containing protein [Acidobacteriota bacterium]
MKNQRSEKYIIIELLRIITQFIFFFIFFYLILITKYPEKDVLSAPVNIFFKFDPLIPLVNLVSSHILLKAFYFSLITLMITILFGRFFCGWICPLGSLLQLFSFIFRKAKIFIQLKDKESRLLWKYYLLIAFLIFSIFSVNLFGIIDPFSLLYRSFTNSVFPVAGKILDSVIFIFYSINMNLFVELGDRISQFMESYYMDLNFDQGLFIGLIFLVIIFLNSLKDRFWCRALCPLGALLGIFGNFSFLKLKLDRSKCNECKLCNIRCPTEATPFPENKWKASECIFCFTCAKVCPYSGITFPLESKPALNKTVNFEKRKLIFTGMAGVVLAPFFKISSAVKNADPSLIRPPGAVKEEEFVKKCIKCSECIKVCPTNGLHPSLFEGGFETLWTPKLVPKIGYCEYNCYLCSQVCPTDAIEKITMEKKKKIHIGTAFVDKDRCLPFSFGINCIVCEEHCPTSPKAIKMVEEEVTTKDGKKIMKVPVVIPEECIGCGICEYKCPVRDLAAIRITSVGETRSEKNVMLL